MVSPDDDDEEGFLEKHKVKLIMAGLLVVGAVTFFVVSPKEAPKKKSSVSMVNIIPPLPPPPPPPPPKERPPEPETTKEEKFTPEEAPQAAPVAAEPDPAPMGTNIQGDGAPDAFGLAKGGGGGMIGGSGTGRGGPGGSKFGSYAGQVQSRVVDALRNHKKTRAAALNVKVRVWADPTGRITRATLAGTSGDAALDRTIRDEILTGLQLQTPPPDGMPMPIVMRISATRPN